MNEGIFNMKRLRKFATMIVCVFLVFQVVSITVGAADTKTKFGEIKEFNQISANDGIKKALYANDVSYDNPLNWARPQYLNYFKKLNGNLFITAYNENTNKLDVFTLNNSYDVIKKKTVKLPMYIYGAIHQGSDGYYYLLTGEDNPSESRTKDVVSIAKYDSEFNFITQTIIKSDAVNASAGIVEPLRCGQSSMAIINGILVVHTSRTMFVKDGLNHESNITFYINTATMKEIKNLKQPYTSHSFNQFVKTDGTNLYFIDHGDAHPRSVVSNAILNFNTPNQITTEHDLFSITGTYDVDRNLTGTTVNAFELGSNGGFVFGKSVPHNHAIQGINGDLNSKKNIYAIKTNKNGASVKFRWLTGYHPTKTAINVGDPRVVKMANNRFAVFYDEEIGGKHSLVYMLIDENLNMLVKRKYANIYYSGNAAPIYYNNEFVFLAGKDNDYNSFSLYHIPYLTKNDSNIMLNYSNPVVNAGSQLKFDVSYNPSGTSTNHIKWRSGNPKIFTVDSTGIITAKQQGTAWLYAEAGNGYKTQTLIKVLPKPSVKITPNKKDLTVGGSAKLKATIVNAKAQITWRSKNSKIASVDQTGKVTAKAPGIITISAKTADGVQGEAQIHVFAKPTSIKLNYSQKIVTVGKSTQFKANIFPGNANRSIKWRTSNSRIATVDQTGKVTAKATGTVYVYAKTINGLEARATVKVIPQPTGVKLNISNKTLTERKATQLKATVYPSNANQAVTWRSSNSKVASVNKNGRVVAHAPGTAYIYAKAINGKEIKTVIKVIPEPTGYSLSYTSLMTPGESQTISVSLKPSNADQTIKWYSSDPNVATVDKYGKVKAKAEGHVYIIGKAVNGMEIEARITVFDFGF